MFLNNYEIDFLEARVANFADEVPNFATAVGRLARLHDWVNSTSDGWGYWRKPSNAAKKLMTLISNASRGAFPPDEDISEKDLIKATAPIKAFFSRNGVDGDVRDWILDGTTH